MKKAAAFKQVIPSIFIICCLVMVLAYQNCGPQKMLVTKVGLSSLCDTDPSRPECTQTVFPTPIPTPIDPGTLGTCNDRYGWCVRFFNVADPMVNPSPEPAAQFPILRQPGTQPGVELSFHYENGIPGAVPLGVTANSWSMVADVWWIPAAQGSLRFVIEYSGTVKFTYSVINAITGQEVSANIIEQNSYNGTNPSFLTRSVDLTVNLPATPPGYHLLRIVWQHTGTTPAHLRIVTPTSPTSATPTPTPASSPGGSATPPPSPTPTPTPTPNALAGKILWNMSYFDSPVQNVNPRCPNGLVEVGAIHGADMSDSKLVGTGTNSTGWLSLCAPSITDAKISVGTSANPPCAPNAASYDRLFSARLNGSSAAMVRGVDSNGNNVTGNFTTYYSVCINRSLNTAGPAPGGRLMIPVPQGSQSTELEVTCPPNYFLSGAYNLSTAGHFVSGQLYSSETDPGVPANAISSPSLGVRMGYCIRQDMTSIAELASLSNVRVGAFPSSVRKIYWPAPTARAQLDMKVVMFSSVLGGRMNPPIVVPDGVNEVTTDTVCGRFEARVVSCYKTGQPQQGCFISNKMTSYSTLSCMCDDSCGSCLNGNAKSFSGLQCPALSE